MSIDSSEILKNIDDVLGINNDENYPSNNNETERLTKNPESIEDIDVSLDSIKYALALKDLNKKLLLVVSGKYDMYRVLSIDINDQLQPGCLDLSYTNAKLAALNDLFIKLNIHNPKINIKLGTENASTFIVPIGLRQFNGEKLCLWYKYTRTTEVDRTGMITEAAQYSPFAQKRKELFDYSASMNHKYYLFWHDIIAVKFGIPQHKLNLPTAPNGFDHLIQSIVTRDEYITENFWLSLDK